MSMCLESERMPESMIPDEDDELDPNSEEVWYDIPLGD